MTTPMTRERLDEIRALLGPPDEQAIGLFPIEDAAEELLAEVERLEAEVKAAHRYADEQIALNSRTLDAIVELLRPGETLDDDGILAAVRALVALRDAVSAERECLRRWHAATAKPWPEADDDAIGLGMEYSRMFDATNEALVEAKKERA